MAIMASVAICSASGSFGPETTLRDFFNRAYCRLKLSGKSINTKRLYDVTLRNFDNYLGRPATLADLNDDTVTAHIGWYIDRGRSPRTGNKARDQLLAVWRFAARKRFVDEWPDVEPLPEYKRTPTAWTPEQFSRLVTIASSPVMVSSGRIKHPHATIYGVPTTIWWPALLLTIYDTGIRIGAALQLRCSDYSPETKRLHVRAESQKTRADQDFILSEQTAKVVETCIASADRELLFPCAFRYSLYYRFKCLLRKAGLPHGRLDKFHRIRKTTATMAELHVGPGTAQRLLDHSSPRLTNDHYLDQSMLPTAAIAEKLPRPVLKTEIHDLVALSLDSLLLDYSMSFGGGSSRKSVVNRVKRLFEQCGMTSVADLDGARLLAAIAVRMQRPHDYKPPISALVADDYRQACRRFVEWLIGNRGILGPTLEAFSLLSDHHPPMARYLAENPDLLAIGGAE